jgi:hypothetical protein
MERAANKQSVTRIIKAAKKASEALIISICSLLL